MKVYNDLLSTSYLCPSLPLVEPRHVPTHVGFLSTPDGGRIASVVGGRTFSAATTADGKVFKWGLNCQVGRWQAGESRRGEAGGESQGDIRNEDNGRTAIEASIPRQVAGVGLEVTNSRFGNAKCTFGLLMQKLDI